MLRAYIPALALLPQPSWDWSVGRPRLLILPASDCGLPAPPDLRFQPPLHQSAAKVAFSTSPEAQALEREGPVGQDPLS